MPIGYQLWHQITGCHLCVGLTPTGDIMLRACPNITLAVERDVKPLTLIDQIWTGNLFYRAVTFLICWSGRPEKFSGKLHTFGHSTIKIGINLNDTPLK